MQDGVSSTLIKISKQKGIAQIWRQIIFPKKWPLYPILDIARI